MRAPLDGSTILVTGASSGIGREIARQLAPRAKKLVLVARRADRLEALRDELVALRPDLVVICAPCDLADRDATDRMLADVARDAGHVDVLVNNAGFGDFALVEHAAWDKLLRMIDVDITALAQLTHRLVPGMVERRRGGVLNISSGWGLTWMPGLATYAGSKHFVSAFTEALRVEVASARVVVTQVCPGPVTTEFETVLENKSGLDMPRFVYIDADKCARQALRGFERGRALVIPGFFARLLIDMGRMTPRWMLRLVYAPVASRIRKSSVRAG